MDRLSARGLVERIPSETDRRHVLVRMTEEGHRQTWALHGPMVVEGQRQLGRLTIAEPALMARQLETVTELTDRHRDGLAGD